MSHPSPVRVRFRFRVRSKLNIAAAEHRLHVGGREVVLSSRFKDVLIKESEWLVMSARGFASETDARAFACRLRLATEVSSVAARLGLDAGLNLPTSEFSLAVKAELRDQFGAELRGDVHGIDVFPDEPNVRIISVRP